MLARRRNELIQIILTGATAGITFLLWVNKSQPVAAADLTTAPGYNVSVFATDPSGAGNPDSITVDGNYVFVGYGNGHAPDGSDGLSSTIAEYSLGGQLLKTYTVQGHNDGLRIDPTTHQLWALSNEDANPKLTIIDPTTGGQTQYNFPEPTAHGGGYDDLAFLNGQIFISASNPTLNSQGYNPGPALGTLILPTSGNTVQLTPVLNGSKNLPLTDPDSLGTTPQGGLTLDSQGDQQLVVLNNPGTIQQQQKVVNLATEVDDTVFAPKGNSFLLVAQTVNGDKSDGGLGKIYKITGDFKAGSAYSAETKLGDVGSLNFSNGQITPVVSGILSPHGLAFVSVPEPDSVLGVLSLGVLGIAGCLKRRSG